MKKKVIISFSIFILLLIGLFANSYVQALSREERITNGNKCEPYENCPVYYQNNHCMEQNNECLQRNYNNGRHCHNQQNCTRRMCVR